MKNSSVTAKKRFGQNFLKDESVLRKIIEAMPNNNNKIVEIGPGLGDLTKFLVNVKSVVAFEVDTDLCKRLDLKFKSEIQSKKLVLHCGDVLQNWHHRLLCEPYDLIANLPYYIATNIILRALADPMCENILVMVQHEVAKKFSASSGESSFSALSVLTQSVGSASIVIDVPPAAFEPMPKVQSSVKNLSSKYEKSLLLDIFKSQNLLHNIRPHQITAGDYHQLYKKL